MAEKKTEVKAQKILMDDVAGIEKLGQSGTQYYFDGPSTEILEVFPNRTPDRDYVVSYYTDEYTARCPKTGQPDYGEILIEYVPDKWCIETKSLKLYIFAFRDVGIFMETATNKILDDLVAVSKPKWMRVTAKFKPRGGIIIEVVTEYGKKPV